MGASGGGGGCVPGVAARVATAAQFNLPSLLCAGTFSASWTLPFQPAGGDGVLNGDLYMTDDFGGQNGENLPGYTTTNVRLEWNGIAESGFDMAVYVRN